MGNKSTALIVALVFGVLFSLLSITLLVRPDSEFKTRPRISQEGAMNIAIAQLQKDVAPLHSDRYVEAQRYFGSPLDLVFVLNNGTIYTLNENGSIKYACDSPDCGNEDDLEPFKGHLFYGVNGSWQDSSVGNCSNFVYDVDAETGAILWSHVDDSNAERCYVRPPEWQ